MAELVYTMQGFDICINNATIKVALFVETKLRVICMYIVLKSNSAKSHSLLSHTFTSIYSIHVSFLELKILPCKTVKQMNIERAS